MTAEAGTFSNLSSRTTRKGARSIHWGWLVVVSASWMAFSDNAGTCNWSFGGASVMLWTLAVRDLMLSLVLQQFKDRRVHLSRRRHCRCCGGRLLERPSGEVQRDVFQKHVTHQAVDEFVPRAPERDGGREILSPGLPLVDGFSAKFFKRFSGIFEPQMYDPMKRFLEVGKMPETWTSGVVTMIPKTKAMQTPDSLRPIPLQTTRQKWLTNILLIQLEDVLLRCTPSQQTGFLRHRSILQHVYGSRALWDGLSEGAALSVDFRNAFPTMSHEMVSAALGLMCIPFFYIRLILHLLRAPHLYSVGKGYVPGVYHYPRAGTRQGDPLSPALFSLVASFVIFPLQDLGPALTVMMYADDLIIFFDGRANPQLLKRVWEVVSRFGQFSGLKINLNKTAAIVRNCGGMEWARCFRDIGEDVKNFVKYLGVRLGNIRHQQDDQGWGPTIEQAFAPALQEAFRRARVVYTLQLSMNERAFMLTSWILPVVAWVSKAYYAPVSVIRQLKLVYHVSMGTNSWGITLPILSRPRTQGGLALPEPELFLMHQAAAPFVSLLGEPHKFPDKAVETFYAWATAIGFTPSKDNLPYIQLGMV